jgi:hypothetical protein
MAWFTRSGRIIRSLLGVSENARKQRPHRRSHSRLHIEQLEDRVVPSTVNWINPNGGDWDTKANWSTGQIPGAGDDVVIPALNNKTDVVTHSAAFSDSVASITSQATVSLSAGQLTIGGDVSISTPVPGVNPVFQLAGGIMSGGTITPLTTLQLTDAGGSLIGLTVDGVIDGTGAVPKGSYNFATISGGLTLDGAANLGASDGSSAAKLEFVNNVSNLSGTGTVTFGSAADNAVYATAPVGNATLTIGADITVVGGSGTVGGLNTTDSFVNDGTINLQRGTITLEGIVANYGLFEVSSVGVLTIGSGSTLANYDGATDTLSDGSYIVGGTFSFPGAFITQDNANITLDGSLAQIKDSVSNTSALTALDLIEGGASLTLAGASLSTINPLTNHGSVTIDAGTLTVQGNSTQVTANGFPAPSFTLLEDGIFDTGSASTFMISDGVLQGTGQITGSVINADTVSPGSNSLPGIITITGAYLQTATGTLDIELDGTAKPGVDYSVLAVSENATLDGTLNVTLGSGYIVAPGSTYQILQFAASIDTFTTLTGLGVGIGNSIALDLNYGTSSLTLSADAKTGTSLSITVPQVTFSSFASQPAQVMATVFNPYGTVNGGTVTFTLADSFGNIISQMTSGTVTGGQASATLTIPAGQASGDYVLSASYGGATGFLASSAQSTLVISATTSTNFPSSPTTSFSYSDQPVTLTANVNTPDGKVTEGTVSFTVFNSLGVQIGGVSSGAVTNGVGTAIFQLPGGSPVGIYTVQAAYQDLSPGRFQPSVSSVGDTLTVTAAHTTTVAAAQSIPFNLSSQAVVLSASVTSTAGTINSGTITFTLFQGTTQIGTPVTSGAVSGGKASVSYVLPASTPPGSYTIQAYYNPGNNLVFSVDTVHRLTVTGLLTTTISGNASTSYADFSQSVSLSAVVTSGGMTINGGTFVFSIFTAANVQVGASVTSGTVVNGFASATFTVAADQPAATYTIHAQYQPAVGYLTSSDSLHTLTVLKANTTTIASNANAAVATTPELVTLNAVVKSGGSVVNEGTVTFAVFLGTTQIGNAVVSNNITAGSASAIYILPGGTPSGVYAIDATYNPGSDYTTSSDTTHRLSVSSLITNTLVLPPINGDDTVTLLSNQFPFTTPLNATAPAGTTLSYPAPVAIGDNPLYDVQQQYKFQGMGYANFGAAAYVLKASANNSYGNPYYLIQPSNGALYTYDGSGSYAHTFANSANFVIMLGVNVYTDPNLLLKSQAPVDYATLYGLEQQYQFQGVGNANFGAAAYVLRAATNNTFGNPYYLLRSTDGALFAYDGSGGPNAYANTFNNNAPVQFNGAPAILGANVYANPAELTGAGATPSVYAQLYQLKQQFDLQELNGSFYTNTDGHQAQWLYSPVLNQYGEHWYTLTLQTISSQQQAVLTAWQGYADSEVGHVIADLDPGVYTHPTWLTAATAVPNPAAGTATVDNSGNLTINLPSSNFVGTFQVVVTVSDGVATTSRTVTVMATDTAPVLTVQQGGAPVSPGGTVTVEHDDFPVTFTETASGGDAPITVTTSLSSYGQLFALEQQYRFQAVGTATFGATAYVLQAAGNNQYGNPDYLLRPSDGGLFAYDGSGSFSHTFNNVTPLAKLGAVVAADPTMLTNAEAPLDYTALYNLILQYGFQGSGYANVGAQAYVLKAAANNSHGNPYYLIATNGDLYQYDGSGSYASSFNNSANFVAHLDPYVYVNPSVLTGATATPGLYLQLLNVEQTYDLQGIGYAVFGAPAYVFQAPMKNINGNIYYLLSPSGGLYAYDGSGSYAHTFGNSANLVATVDSSVYSNPALLTGAKAPPAATVGGVPVNVSQPSGTPETFVVNAPMSFVGTVEVTVTASDGSLTTTQSFFVTSTDSPPAPAAIPNQTASQSGSPLNVTLSATDADNDLVMYSAVPAGYSPEYDLEQQYHFKGVGMAMTSDGVKAYVLSVNGVNANGNALYLLNSSGAVYAYDGSGSYGHTFANSANFIAQLSPADFTTPTLLTNAKAPTAPPASVAMVTGNVLTINVAGLPVGTIFRILVTASDGAETTTESFLVTVTA